MKIISETPTVLTAKDNAISALIMAPIIALIGLGLIAGGASQKSFPLVVFGLVVLGFGFLLLFNRKARTLTIDKVAGSLVVHVASIRKKQDLRYQTQDVTKMQLVSQYQTNYTNNGGMNSGGGLRIGGGNSNTTQQTHLLLVMRDGTNIDLADGSRSMGMASLVSKVPNQQVGERIAAFLGVQLEVVGPNMPRLGSVVAGVEGMMNHNDAAPSVVPPPAPAQPTAPVPPAGPDAPGFAMPHAMPVVPTAVAVAPTEPTTTVAIPPPPPAAAPTSPLPLEQPALQSPPEVPGGDTSSSDTPDSTS